MDPNANLAEQLRLADQIQNSEWSNEDAALLAELVEALAAWLESGGFLPEAWQH